MKKEINDYKNHWLGLNTPLLLIWRTIVIKMCWVYYYDIFN
jgi:hypothetical protein